MLTICKTNNAHLKPPWVKNGVFSLPGLTAIYLPLMLTMNNINSLT